MAKLKEFGDKYDASAAQAALAWLLAKPFVSTILIGQSVFYLPDLGELSQKKYREKPDHLNTAIFYDIFHRNVLIALERAKNMKMLD